MSSNCIEHLLLLEQSGELSKKQRRLLDRKLASSEEAKRFRNDLIRISRAIPTISSDPMPDAAAAIVARLAQTPKTARLLRSAWKSAFAAAAALALVFGIRALRPAEVSPYPVLASAIIEEDEWTDPLEEDFTELESLIAALSDNPFNYMEL